MVCLISSMDPRSLDTEMMAGAIHTRAHLLSAVPPLAPRPARPQCNAPTGPCAALLVRPTPGAGQPGWGRGGGLPPFQVAFFAVRGRALGGSSGRGAGRGLCAVPLVPVGRQGRGGARRGRCSELREPNGRNRMAAAAGEARRVLVYGGRGALGSRCVQAFRARNWVTKRAGGVRGSAPRASGLGGGRA